MDLLEKLRARLMPIFDGHDDVNNIRIWPTFLWLFISESAGFYSQLIVRGEYRMVAIILSTVIVAIVLFKPMLKISIKKTAK